MCSSKVIVAMSGGVDSSVSALLLKQQGYEVEGLFMKNWEEDDTETYCAAEADVKDAKSVCDKLDIPLHTINFAQEYWDNVFTYFLDEYQKGRTPNPDILCNREIKFKLCMEYALSLGADFFATGHYARNHHQQLLKGLDNNKDQTYFIYTLTSTLLEKIFFPIGHLPKSEVRQLAEDAGLITYNKKDSTGICFIGEKRFQSFLSQYLPAKPGSIQSLDGKVLGQHAGLMYYTIGQRQGIKIGGQKEGSGKPWYVADKDLSQNILWVVQGHEHPALYKKHLQFNHAHWVNGTSPTRPFQCFAKTRYRQEASPCIIHTYDNGFYQVSFAHPQWSITPGQSIVFYQNDICLGGGIIDAAS